MNIAERSYLGDNTQHFAHNMYINLVYKLL